MPRGKTPENETPEARFIRLANIRAGNAVTNIRNLGMLVGSNYKSTAEQHKKLFDTLRVELDKAENALKANKPAGRAVGGIL